MPCPDSLQWVRSATVSREQRHADAGLGAGRARLPLGAYAQGQDGYRKTAGVSRSSCAATDTRHRTGP
jgi:hypothetical protein